MRVGLLQLRSSDDPAANLPVTLNHVRDAAGQGAALIVTPEVTNCVSADRAHQKTVLRPEAEDPTLAALQQAAAELGVHVLIGSLAVKTEEERFANRSFLVSPDGQIVARYDKIHMFDVEVSETESYRESAGYRPGETAVVTRIGDVGVGITVCYDVRFPHLYRLLAQNGAQILTIPSAFSPVTGAAHWEPLLRARAIETGCFVLAPAQSGQHEAQAGRPRKTYGHSMVVGPWGEVLLDMGEEPGVVVLDLDLDQVDTARRRVPSLTADRPFTI
ncbi:carbon-nitrogen hydrolase family protein [Palleronia abyssalis]|uniref:Hydrolase n=1 Tax=Palleronia abyssalis TaxID=1501240 RepID=A0A2R8BSM6_9RHOB|nr:carbon-nitrogen hydrolase family protein [Palleronia abyssalis]SPJ23135.1 Hydrolase [Palleronia abyssalis]